MSRRILQRQYNLRKWNGENCIHVVWVLKEWKKWKLKFVRRFSRRTKHETGVLAPSRAVIESIMHSEGATIDSSDGFHLSILYLWYKNLCVCVCSLWSPKWQDWFWWNYQAIFKLTQRVFIVLPNHKNPLQYRQQDQ